MGSPASVDEVGAFLRRMFSDPEILPLPGALRRVLAPAIAAVRTPSAKRRYALIGGCSPLPGILQGLRRELQRELNFRVHLGFCYSEPFIHRAVREAAEDAEELVGIPLYPHYAKATSGACLRRFYTSAGEAGVKARAVERWGSFAPFVDALCERLREALELHPEAAVVFSAHSLPEEQARADRYPEQVEETCRLVAEKAGVGEWWLGYQSGLRFGRWLKPGVREVLRMLVGRGVRQAVVVPVSFVADNLETLYDIDVELSRFGERLGMKVWRCRALNTSPSLVRALAGLAESYSNSTHISG